MCDLYNIKMHSAQLKHAVGFYIDLTNGASFDDNVYPDAAAPILRNNLDGPELAISRWGMPSPEMHINGDADKGITNVCETSSHHWQQWLTVANRCLVPATSFSEYAQEADPLTDNKTLHWFAIDKTEPLFFFAGIWTEWIGVRNPSEGKQNHTLFAFLTIHPNSVISPIHPKTMPVILTEQEEMDKWMTAPWEIAKNLQRPASDQKLLIFN